MTWIHRKPLALIVALLLSISLIGCASKGTPKPLPAGAYNQTDANLYDSLVTARGAIDGACQPGTSVATNDCKLKPELVAYKAQFNSAIHAWNIAAAAETAYRSALKNGGSPDPNVVATAVAQAVAEAAALVTSMIGGK